jgi:hypothetical protein
LSLLNYPLSVMSQEEYGIVILLDNFGTRDRMINNLDEFITDWDAVLTRIEQDIARLRLKISDTHANLVIE